VSILFASRAASSNGTNSVSGSPNVRVYSIWGKPTISMPADPPAALSARPAGFVPGAAPTFAISIPRALRPAHTPSGTTFPRGFPCNIDCKRMAQDIGVLSWNLPGMHKLLAVVFHFGREPFRANDRAAASIE
jgi:hypothetical protein